MKTKLALVAVTVGLIALAFLPIDYDDDALLRALFDAGHFPMLFLITLAAYIVLRPSKLSQMVQLGRSGALGTGVVFGIEFIQPMFGRTRSVLDLKIGLLGVIAALLAVEMWRRRPTPWIRIGYGLVLVAICVWVLRPAWQEWRTAAWQRSEFPMLADFETDRALSVWHAHGTKTAQPAISVSTLHASSGERSLEIKTPGKSWHSVGYSVAYRDWSRATGLAFDLYNPGDLERIGTYVIDSRDNRFEKWIPVKAGWNKIHISGEMLRENPALQMDSIRYVTFATDENAPARTFYLDNLRVIEESAGLENE